MKCPAVLAAMWCVMCIGCVSHARADATTMPSTDKTLVLSDAVDLDQLTKDGEADLSHQLRLSRGGRIYFGTINTFDNDEKQTSSLPIIARKNGENWKALPIRDPRLKDAAWSYVGGGPHRGELWGVLDSSLDEDQPELLLAHSMDGGAKFVLSTLKKPDPKADFDSFCIGPDGKGRVTVYLAPDPDNEKSKPGYYHFRTSDGGKTWAKPEYESDVMWPARDVPDEDQPATSQAPPRKV
jgi:hypothetical protein